MRTIKIALVGYIAFFFLLSAPAIAAKAIVVQDPQPIVQTYQQTHAAYFYAITGGGENPNEQVPAFMGEGVIAALIVIFGVYAGDARKKRLDNRRRLYSNFQSALEDFQELSLAVQLNRAKGYDIDYDIWRELNAAKARVDAAANAVLDIASRPVAITPLAARTRYREEQEARLAKEKTSEILKRLENPPDPAAPAAS
jgi:hypothetical protein